MLRRNLFGLSFFLCNSPFQFRGMIKDGILNSITFHDPTRIGRNTNDVLTIWEEMTKRGIVLLCLNPIIRNIDEDGTIHR